MPKHVLLVSNPPHPRPDIKTAALVLGLLPDQVEPKLRYGVPEIWMAESTDEKVSRAHKILATAGVRTVVATSDEVQAVPPPRIVRSIEFTYDSMYLGGVEVTSADAPLILPCYPRAAEGAPPNLRSEVVPGVAVYDTTPFLHLYLANGARLGIYGELVDFTFLGPQKSPNAQRNINALESTLRARLPRAKFDERLTNIQLRRRWDHGVPVNFTEARKGYSYASPGLDALLADISPDLANITQSEWSSRLCYLTDSVVVKLAAGDDRA